MYYVDIFRTLLTSQSPRYSAGMYFSKRKFPINYRTGLVCVCNENETRVGFSTFRR